MFNLNYSLNNFQLLYLLNNVNRVIIFRIKVYEKRYVFSLPRYEYFNVKTNLYMSTN